MTTIKGVNIMKSHLKPYKNNEMAVCYDSSDVQGLSDIILNVKAKTLASRIYFIAYILKTNINDLDYSSAKYHLEKIDRSLEQLKLFLNS
jgi:hypothetical protein